MREKKHIGIFRQVPLDISEEMLAEEVKLAERDAKTIQDFYRRYARHKWDVQVRGYAMRGEQETRPPYYAYKDIKNFMSEYDMQGFDPNYFQVFGGASDMCGNGNMPGSRSAVYQGCGSDSMIHELGHNFGLHHASTYDGETLIEYGDRSSMMGAGTSRGGLNSVDLVRLGLESDREILKITKTQQVLICPIELPPHGMHINEYQHISVKGVHISLRKEKGAHCNFWRNREDTLYVHEYKSDLHSIRLLPDLKPGQSKNLSNGAKIEYLEYANETARVNIYYEANDPRPADLPMPSGFPKSLPGVSVEPKHSGAWYNPDFTGEGFDIHIHDNKLVLYWYTYNHKYPDRRFYFGEASLTDGVVEFDIMTTTNGTWEDPSSFKVEKAGSGQIYFLGKANGIFNFKLEELGRGSIEIIPVAISSTGGIYYQPSRNGEGFTIQFYGDMCVAYWYSYGPSNRRDNSSQRWYVCSGTKNNYGVYNLVVYEAQDNEWMGLREGPGIVEIGTADLIVIDENNITFTYDIPLGAGNFKLEKLF